MTEYQKTASLLAARMWAAIDEKFVGYWFNLVVTRTPSDDADN